jgi:hypothetical protein
MAHNRYSSIEASGPIFGRSATLRCALARTATKFADRIEAVMAETKKMFANLDWFTRAA